MPLDSDAIVDRRRMRRKLTFWRAAAIVIAIVAVVGTVARVRGAQFGVLGTPVGASIARIKITGLIRNDDERVAALERLGRSNVKAVIVHIDSPGGTTAGSEQLHDALRRLAAKKPMVVVVDGLAASGAYIAAMASDEIIAQETSLVGSIGVLFQFPNVSDLLKTIGVKVEEVKSTPLKAAPNGFEPTSPEARAALDSIVQDSYAWFKDLVRNRRHLDDAQLARASDGRVFTGRQALGMKLVDALGNEQTARAWLAKQKGIDSKTPVTDWKLNSRFGDFSFLHMAAIVTLDAVGLPSLARRLEGATTLQTIERLNLDGLLALWHPPGAN
jgi:protease-4